MDPEPIDPEEPDVPELDCAMTPATLRDSAAAATVLTKPIRMVTSIAPGGSRPAEVNAQRSTAVPLRKSSSGEVIGDFKGEW